jgi:hypothetical protein
MNQQQDQWPAKTMLTDEDLIQHASDLLNHTPMAHVQPVCECIDRFRRTFGSVSNTGGSENENMAVS